MTNLANIINELLGKLKDCNYGDRKNLVTEFQKHHNLSDEEIIGLFGYMIGFVN